MLYNGRIGSIQKIIFLSLLIVILIALSACSVPKGSIIILENPNGTGFTMDFKEWSSKDKCEISLNEGDVLQIEVFREGGKIALTVSGKNGSEPYTGNDLQSRKFTVTIHETDRYEIQITGKGATGKVIVKKVAADTGA